MSEEKLIVHYDGIDGDDEDVSRDYSFDRTCRAESQSDGSLKIFDGGNKLIAEFRTYGFWIYDKVLDEEEEDKDDD